MKRTIGFAMVAIACAALGCDGHPYTKKELELLAGPSADISALANIPMRDDDDIPQYRYANDGVPATLFSGSHSRDTILRTTAMMVSASGDTRHIESFYWPDTSELSAEDLERLRLTGERAGRIAPPNYWDVGANDYGDGSAVSIAAVDKATCTGLPDQCRPGFEPECYGGGSSPGGNRESSVGCSGSQINYGGPGIDRPDNASISWSWWSGFPYSCNDDPLDQGNSGSLKWITDWLNARDTILPPPFELWRRDCDAQGQPWGWITDPFNPAWQVPKDQTLSTLVDVLFQYFDLRAGGAGANFICPVANNTGPGTVNADWKIAACTVYKYKLDGEGYPAWIKTNNGATDYYFRQVRGALVTIDPGALNWMDGFAGLDKGSVNKATRLAFWESHVTAHELGHAIGLTHSYVGSESWRWITHSHGGKSINPNVVPLSVMQRDLPAAPYTLIGWSSGLAANLQNWDSATSGQGNAEAWRMSNHFRTVYGQGGETFPKNSFAPPLTATNGEM